MRNCGTVEASREVIPWFCSRGLCAFLAGLGLLCCDNSTQYNSPHHQQAMDGYSDYIIGQLSNQDRSFLDSLPPGDSTDEYRALLRYWRNAALKVDGGPDRFERDPAFESYVAKATNASSCNMGTEPDMSYDIFLLIGIANRLAYEMECLIPFEERRLRSRQLLVMGYHLWLSQEKFSSRILSTFNVELLGRYFTFLGLYFSNEEVIEMGYNHVRLLQIENGKRKWLDRAKGRTPLQ